MYESATTYRGNDLDTSYEIQLSFELNYGGKVYNKIYAATSGHLAFSDMTEDWYSNSPLSNVGIPFIAVYWDDLNFYKENSGIYYKQGIENGVKYLLVEYRDVSLYDGSENETANFEVKIYENGDILMSYQNVDFGDAESNNGLTAVVGIKTYYHGTYQYLAYERLLGPNKSILFK